MAQRHTVSGRRSAFLWLSSLIGLALVVALVVIVLFVYPTYQRRQQVAQHYQAGGAFQNVEDWDKAAQAYEEAIVIDANYKDVQTRLAEVKARLVESEATATAVAMAQAEQVRVEAQATAAAAPTATAEALETHYQKGLAYMNLGRWENAKTELEQVLAVDPNYKDVQAKLAQVEAEIAKLIPMATLTPIVTLTPIPTQVPNYALAFDGVDDYVEIPSSDFMNRLPLTVEAWVRPELRTDGTDFPNNVISNDNPARYGHGFGVNVWSKGSQLKIEFQDGWAAPPSITFNQGEWYHVAIVYEDGNIKAYVNGNLVISKSHSQKALDGSNYVRIGNHNDDTGYKTRRFFKGVIDEVRIWNVVRTKEEIQADMSRRLNGDEPGLVGYWPFDEGTGNIVFDQTASGSHGLQGSGSADNRPAWVVSTAPIQDTADSE